MSAGTDASPRLRHTTNPSYRNRLTDSLGPVDNEMELRPHRHIFLLRPGDFQRA